MPWLRSEEMMYVELVTSATEAHDVLQFLGRYPDGIIQFSDLNKRKAAYERPQTKQIAPWEGALRCYFAASRARCVGERAPAPQQHPPPQSIIHAHTLAWPRPSPPRARR